MGLRVQKEAVKIDDRVHDTRGTFIGWKDVTDQVGPEVNESAYKMVYSTHKDTNIPVLHKMFSVLGRIAFDLFDNTWAFEVTSDAFPESAIGGFPDGMTVTGMEREKGTPDKRIILHNNVDGEATYIEKTGPESQSEKVSSLKQKVNDLKMQLKAEESKSHELSEQVDRENDSSSSGRRNEYYPEDEGFVGEGEYRG